MIKIEITGLSKEAVLAALYNNTSPLGVGIYNPRANQKMTEEDFKEIFVEHIEASIDNIIWFDYVSGRPIKVGFEEMPGSDRIYLLRADLYDRDSNRPAADIIKELRNG